MDELGNQIDCFVILEVVDQLDYVLVVDFVQNFELFASEQFYFLPTVGLFALLNELYLLDCVLLASVDVAIEGNVPKAALPELLDELEFLE